MIEMFINKTTSAIFYFQKIIFDHRKFNSSNLKIVHMKFPGLLFFCSFIVFLFGCKKDDDGSNQLPLIPIAAFSMDKTVAEVGETITFTNESQNATTYTWDFGDGSTDSTDSKEEANYAYTEEGAFMVTLTAEGDGGSDSVSKAIMVKFPDPIADFTMDKSMAGAGEVIAFTNASLNAETYLWDFGDGNTSPDENPSHSYMSDSTYTINLTAYGNGKEDSISKTIEIETILDGDWKATTTESDALLNYANASFTINGNNVSISNWYVSTSIGLFFGSNWSEDLSTDNSFDFSPQSFIEYSINLETSTSGTGTFTFDGQDYAMEVIKQ